MADLTWHEKDIIIVLPVVLTLFAFLAYWIITHSDTIKRYLLSRPDDKSAIRYLLFQKLFGAIILGFIPYLFCNYYLPFQTTGIQLWSETHTEMFIWILASISITIPLTYYNAKKPEHFDHYPQLRIKNWSYRTLMIYLGAWSIYIIGYEFLFRGVLLFPLAHTIGIWPAIAINTVIYSVVHLLNSPKEAIASIPFGIVLCIVTLETNMILPAIVIHLSITWTNAITAVKYNPEIRFPVNDKTIG